METEKLLYQIAAAVKNAGGRVMLVGGCVRDTLLNNAVKDYDLEIYGINSEQLFQVLAPVCEVDPAGASFGILKVRHAAIDIAMPRKDSKRGRGHRGFIVETDPFMDFASAASRRDFTVNAIMKDALTGEIIDPCGGCEDLKRGILRHVSAAFVEDPLRVLRGMQFISRFGFEPAAETVKLCASLTQDELASERIGCEWEKMLLEGKYISRGLDFLRACRWVRFYPELENLINCPQDPRWHPEGDVWNHTARTIDAAVQLRGRSGDPLIFMLAALCHDFGKASCTVIESSGNITSCGHDTDTAAAKKFITSIWKRTDLTEKVIPLIERHMHPWQLAENDASDKAYRKLALHVKNNLLLADLAEADIRGIDMDSETLSLRISAIDRFRQRCNELEIAGRVPEPLILGRHLIARGMKPGKEFKPLLDRCFEAQLSGVFSNLEDALKFLDKILPCVK